MASFTDGNRKSFGPKTGVDLSAKQYYIVKQDTATTVDLAASATAGLIIGTVNNADKSGQTVEVFMRNGAGSHKVKLGGTVTLGAYLTANASGLAIATTSSGDQVLGFAAAAGVSGDVIEYFPAGFIKY